MQNKIFNDLFVLELANNHWGSLDRGIKIIRDFAKVVKKNNIKATIKFQFRDVDNFIHSSYRDNEEIRYINKIIKTKISWNDIRIMFAEVAEQGMLTMATPFDEFSVLKCKELNVDLVKIASSDAKDKNLIKKICNLKIPTIASSGGCSLENLDWMYNYFKKSNIPFALNHCVSIYPSEDNQLELNQIDFFKKRYDDIVIGFSSHEYTSWDYSMMVAYAKGARTFERHIDIDFNNIQVSKYCSLPGQIDDWFKAFQKAKDLCGRTEEKIRNIKNEESEYLKKLVRGVYLKKNKKPNSVISSEDVYFAIPKLEGQISCQDSYNNIIIKDNVNEGQPLMSDNIIQKKIGDLSDRFIST
tara:strand:+ start:376 stop:1443 length:1068 start_codon:yes stop_codon:yes gene_type:complete